MTVHKTDAEWRDQLTDIEYRVTREAATERPFTGKYWDHWDRGVYNCVCCGTRSSNRRPSSTRAAAGRAISSPSTAR